MDEAIRTDLYHGVFHWHPLADGQARLTCHTAPPSTIPDPQTGRQLRISTIQGSTRAICPACAKPGDGGFVSFVADLRLAYACPQCRRLVWISGA